MSTVGVSGAVKECERVVVRFAGGSGDGMQLAGSRFPDATARQVNDLATLPNSHLRLGAGRDGGPACRPSPSRSILTPAVDVDLADLLVASDRWTIG